MRLRTEISAQEEPRCPRKDVYEKSRAVVAELRSATHVNNYVVVLCNAFVITTKNYGARRERKYPDDRYVDASGWHGR